MEFLFSKSISPETTTVPFDSIEIGTGECSSSKRLKVYLADKFSPEASRYPIVVPNARFSKTTLLNRISKEEIF